MVQSPSPLTNRPEGRTDELERLRQRVDDLRAAIGWDVDELRSRVREAFDPGRQVAKHPFVAAAVLIGGVYVATRIVRSLVSRVRTPETKPSRRGKVRTLGPSRPSRVAGPECATLN